MVEHVQQAPESGRPPVETPLRDTLERTGFRASLSPEYLTGHAPTSQRKEQQVTPERPTYYGLPAIKHPEWRWYVPAYFFVGGISSGAFIIATLLDMLGHREDRPLIRAGHIVALVGMLLSPLLLIADLGRPERWFNMLRVFRPRSMMNAGSWGITIFGGFAGIAAVGQIIRSMSPRNRLIEAAALPIRVISWIGMVPAIFVGSYTGVLLASTNVPLWARNRLLMGPLFLSSALSTGLAAIQLVARLFGPTSRHSANRLRRAESVAFAAEIAMTAGSGLVLRRLAGPLLASPIGIVYQLGSLGLGIVAPLMLRSSRRGTKMGQSISAALVLIGGLIMRFAIVEAGMRSADDPHAYFEYTKPGQES